MEESPVEAPEGEAAAVENAEEPTQVAMAAEGDAPAPSPAAASTALVAPLQQQHLPCKAY